MYDTTNYDSFEHVADWLQEAKKQIEPNCSEFILVGTKVDMEHLRGKNRFFFSSIFFIPVALIFFYN